MVYLVLVVGAGDNGDNYHPRRSDSVAKSCDPVGEVADFCGHDSATCDLPPRRTSLSPPLNRIHANCPQGYPQAVQGADSESIQTRPVRFSAVRAARQPRVVVRSAAALRTVELCCLARHPIGRPATRGGAVRRRPQDCRAVLLIRLVKSVTWLYKLRRSAISCRILRSACMTVVWSRPPKAWPIFGRDRSVSSRQRYIAI